MEYRNLGSTGLKVSVLSYGSWVSFHTQVDVNQAKDLMKICVDAGINFFDNAEAYAAGKSEEVMGEAIKEAGWKRSDLVLSTKLFWGGKGPNDRGLSRKHIIEGTKASLARMGTDYVDLLYCHRPDISTPIEETVRAMNFVIDQGWAFYWGTSEWSAQQITQAWEVAKRLDMVGPAMEQPQYNLFERQKVEVEFEPLYKQYGLGLTTWSPLAFGILSGKYSQGNVPADSRLGLESYKHLAKEALVQHKLEKVDKLKPIAEELGCSLAQLSIAWAASNPNVSSVITGATKAHQVEDNLKSLEVMKKLTPDVRDKIEKVMDNKPKPLDTYNR